MFGRRKFAGDLGGTLDLEVNDPKWQALSTPGTDTTAESGGIGVTTVGVLDEYAGELTNSKQLADSDPPSIGYFRSVHSIP